MADATAKTTGTDLAERNVQLEVLAKAILDGDELPGGGDPEAMSRAIAERILNADSVEAAFSPQSLTPWRSMLEVPVKIVDVHFNRSGFEGQSIYAVADVVGPDGEIHTVTCGGRNVMAQLVVGVKNGWFETNTFQLVEKKTSEGFGALWLEIVGEAA